MLVSEGGIDKKGCIFNDYGVEFNKQGDVLFIPISLINKIRQRILRDEEGSVLSTDINRWNEYGFTHQIYEIHLNNLIEKGNKIHDEIKSKSEKVSDVNIDIEESIIDYVKFFTDSLMLLEQVKYSRDGNEMYFFKDWLVLNSIDKIIFNPIEKYSTEEESRKEITNLNSDKIFLEKDTTRENFFKLVNILYSDNWLMSITSTEKIKILLSFLNIFQKN